MASGVSMNMHRHPLATSLRGPSEGAVVRSCQSGALKKCGSIYNWCRVQGFQGTTRIQVALGHICERRIQRCPPEP